MLRLYDKYNRDITDSRQYCSSPSCLGQPWCSAWGICKEEQLTACGGSDGMAQQQEAAGGSGSILDDEQEREIDQMIIELSQQIAEEEQVIH